MKYAADFRFEARRALTGRWGIAVGASFLASLLGGASSNSSVSFNTSSSSTSLEDLTSSFDSLSSDEMTILIAILILVFGMVLIFSIALAFIGSIISIGYSRFNLDLIDFKNQPNINTLFGYFRFWKTAICTSLLKGLYVFLWTLLFIIPGIIASYDYAMTDYILAEHPELTATQAIEQSKMMMFGNRFRLFCLELSFIGWDFLCMLTLGIGFIWLIPYKQASYAAFYREISGTSYEPEQQVYS